MVQVQNITKRYGKHVAVDNVSFRVDKGEIVGFLGPNGAGKSTTMNIITGYLSATAGSVSVDGYDVLDSPNEVKQRLGYLPELPPLYDDMTAAEYLAFVAKVKKTAAAQRKSDLERIVQIVGVEDVYNRLLKNLSKGYRQRVGLAQALIGNPDVLILDEPTIGLDPHQIIEIRRLITELGKEHTIVLSSHILPEVSAVCERIMIINNGRLVASDTPENLAKSLAQSTQLALRVAGPADQVHSTLSQIEGVTRVSSQGTIEPETVDLLVDTKKSSDVRKEIFFALSKAGYPLYMLKSVDLTLEEVFLQLTTTEAEV